MGNLSKEFADILNEQGFCFDPYEMKIINLVLRAIKEWEYKNKGCSGCVNLGDKKYKCESCARFSHADHYFSYNQK